MAAMIRILNLTATSASVIDVAGGRLFVWVHYDKLNEKNDLARRARSEVLVQSILELSVAIPN
jgi:hypothetical protein